MDLCFVTEGESYRDVLARSGLRHAPAAGEIVDADGRVLATHGGIEQFTVGQRRGLGVATGEKLYVIGLDAERSRVVVGEEAGLYRASSSVSAGSRSSAPAAHSPQPCASDRVTRGRQRSSQIAATAPQRSASTRPSAP